MHKIWCNGQSYPLMYFIEILLKLFGGCWNWLACVKLQIIHCSSFMHCISIYECRFWSPSHVPLSPPAPLCLPWIWKQACRPFPLSHYHIQRGEIGGVGGQRKLRIGSKGKATPSLCHPAFFYWTSLLHLIAWWWEDVLCFSLCLPSISRVPTDEE